jgi:hypothetical protein
MIHYMVYCAWWYFPPAFNKAWVRKIGSDETSHYVFFASMFILFRPKPLALLPIVITELTHVVWWLSGILALINPRGLRMMQYPCDLILSLAFTDVAWVNQSRDEKWNDVLSRVPLYSCRCEIAVGMVLLLELLTPMRNMMLLFMFWQFLRIRYVISPVCRQTFADLDSLCRIVVDHSSCPLLLKSTYERITTYLLTVATKGKKRKGEGIDGGGNEEKNEKTSKEKNEKKNKGATKKDDTGMEGLQCEPCDPALPDLVDTDGGVIKSIYGFKQE